MPERTMPERTKGGSAYTMNPVLHMVRGPVISATSTSRRSCGVATAMSRVCARAVQRHATHCTDGSEDHREGGRTVGDSSHIRAA